MLTSLILCGGRGMRAYPHSLELPKPLLEVGGRPALRHVMDIYAAQGLTRFVLAAGYKADHIERFATTVPTTWTVEVVDTGEATNTGGRVIRCRDLLGDPFLVNYADGFGNVDLADLVSFHRSHGAGASMTCVPLPSPYGTIDLDSAGRVQRFREKPRLPDHLINAGYFAMSQAAFDHWQGEDLEAEVLPALSAAGQLFAYRHEGFWKSMDTYKDSRDLSVLCEHGPGPWMALPSPSPAAGR